MLSELSWERRKEANQDAKDESADSREERRDLGKTRIPNSFAKADPERRAERNTRELGTDTKMQEHRSELGVVL